MTTLAEADLSMTELAFQDDAQERDPGDDQLLVKFYLESEQDAAETAAKGRPIFKDVEYIQIQVPGQKDSIIQRMAFPEDKTRFPKHWAAFQNKQEVPLEGTPLKAWPSISSSQIEELKYFQVHTVEQLANIADVHAQQFMGINQLRMKARLFLEAAEANAATEKFAAELEARDNEIAALQTQLAEVIKELGEMKEKESDDSVQNSERSSESGRRRNRKSTGQ